MGVNYDLEAKFAYEVENVRYIGHQEWSVGKTRRAYQPDATVTVYYNPENHKKAVISPGGVPSASWQLLVVVLGTIAAEFLVGFGVWMIATCRKPELPWQL